jgi:hypothetical protein
VYTTSPANSTTSNTMTNGNLRLCPWVLDFGWLLDRIGAEITAIGDAGSKLRLGIYADNGFSYPGSLILDAGVIAGDSATAQELNISQWLPPALYWIGGALQVVTTTQPTVRIPTNWTPPTPLAAGTALPTANVIGYQMTGVTGALPASFSSTLSSSGSAPRVFVRGV